MMTQPLRIVSRWHYPLDASFHRHEQHYDPNCETTRQSFSMHWSNKKSMAIFILVMLFMVWVPPTSSLVLPQSPSLSSSASLIKIPKSSLTARNQQTHHLDRCRAQHHFTTTALFTGKKDLSDEDLKQQLLEYLEKRKEANADQLAQETKGKIIGGTRGNAILEYVSGAPVKEQVVDRIPNVFDYDELTRYGYSHLVTPIMDLKGGRRAVYDLMDMEPPSLVGPPPKKNAPKLVIDRTGAEDKARYSGLKLGQVLDDSAMAEALERANQKSKQGEELRPILMEERYVQPFADRRNTGPKLTPDWTPEKLDEYAKKQGLAQSWARRAKLGEFVNDPFETLELSLDIRLYAVLTGLWIAFAYGKSTPSFLSDVVGSWAAEDISNLTETLKVPGLALGLASVGSSVLCAALLAPERNRNVIVWAIKGFFGGPLAFQQLRGLDKLITREEQEAAAKQK